MYPELELLKELFIGDGFQQMEAEKNIYTINFDQYI